MVIKYARWIVVFVAVIAITGTLIYTTTNAATTELAMSSGIKQVDDGVSKASIDVVPSDINSALKPRSMGNNDAPVIIEEFASLTCSHCAHFHTETFGKLKEEYIDTGKVRFIFNDFPLNAPALDASMVARCLPEKNYFKFISFLFSSQDKWAFEKDYQKKLNQNAKLLGLNDEDFNKCINNITLRSGLIANLEASQKKHGIESTPSFVINGKDVVKGGKPIEEFRKIIDALLPSDESSE